MRVLIQAVSAQGHQRLARAGRFFPTGEPVEVEVLDQDEDPPPLVEQVTGPGEAGVILRSARPDPHRMGRHTFEILKADSRLRILQTDDVDAKLSAAALGGARREIERLSRELSDARIEIARIEEALSQAVPLEKLEEMLGQTVPREKHHEALKEIDRLSDLLTKPADSAKAPAPPPSGPSQNVAGSENVAATAPMSSPPSEPPAPSPPAKAAKR